MDTIYTPMRRWGAYCIHITALPLFFLAFILIFDPSVAGGSSFSEFYSRRIAMNTFIMPAIVLGSISLVRMIFTFVCKAKKVRMTWFGYILWCLMEAVITALFLGLYTSLMLRMPFMQACIGTLKLSVTILSIPYIILALGISLHEVEKIKATPAIEDEGLVRFHDENKKLKFVIAPSALFYIKSEENYVRIFYEENRKLRSYVLRNSMKTIEELTYQHGMRRCHRSYILNPAHVKVLKKEPDGVILAEMDFDGIDPIPVSKKYYGSLSELL